MDKNIFKQSKELITRMSQKAQTKHIPKSERILKDVCTLECRLASPSNCFLYLSLILPTKSSNVDSSFVTPLTTSSKFLFFIQRIESIQEFKNQINRPQTKITYTLGCHTYPKTAKTLNQVSVEKHANTSYTKITNKNLFKSKSCSELTRYK